MKAVSDSLGFLGVDDVQLFEELLGKLLLDTGAATALLCDRAGRMLAGAGDLRSLDAVTFASLASADFAASDRLAALLGEDEFTSLYHHGAQRSMFLADIGGVAILATLFDNRTTLGMVRIRTRSVVPRFATHFEQMAQRGPTGNVIQMEHGWATEAESEIDRLFSDR